MEKGMTSFKISMEGKEPILEFDGREMESAILTKTKDGFKGAVRFIELLDKDYLSVPKEFEPMHIALVRMLKNTRAVDELYDLFTTMDAVRIKHFSDYNVIPYYVVRPIMRILLRHSACHMQNGALKKTELFTRFLLLRAEMAGSPIFGKGALKDANSILAEEERASKKYKIPSMDELKTMNFEMLTMEMGKAEDMMAKPKIIKLLKDLRTAKSATKIRKTEKQVMDEAIREEREAQEEDEPIPTTRLAKHQKRKAEQARKDKARFEKSNGRGSKVAVVNSPEGEYVG